jgi:hypothetical protein
MLGRPTFLPLPVVLTFILAVVFTKNRLKLKRPRQLFAASIAGFTLCLTPWIISEWLITGHPSIVTNRYPAYNLFAGCSLDQDGLEVLPGPYVAHPDQYSQEVSAVAREIVQKAKRDPVAFIDLMLRKPVRLLDGPWNEFEVPCWGLPWSAQKWLHQFIMLLCAFGLFAAIKRASSDRRASRLLPPAVLGTMILFIFINLIFVTTRRYMFPVMPAIVVLAAFALRWKYANGNRRQFARFLLLTAALPTGCILTDYLVGAPSQVLANLALHLGIPFVSGTVAFLLSALACTWFLLLAREWNFSKPVLLLWLALMGITISACFTSTARSMRCLEYRIRLAKPHPTIETAISLPSSLSFTNRRFFILADCVPDRSNPAPFRNLALSVNGSPIPGSFQPLLAMDASERENFIYERSFAASGATEVEMIRQWWCIELPPHMVRNATGSLSVRLENKSDRLPVFLAADFFQKGHPIHALSIRRFSWNKGFYIDSPGEMRLDEWHTPPAATAFERGLRPRVSLLIVQDKYGSSSSACTILLPDARIGRHSPEQLVSHTVKGSDLQGQGAASQNDALKLHVSGEARSPAGEASCALVEHIVRAGKHMQEYAPTAPSKIATASEWSPFQFDDLVPLEAPEEQKQNVGALKPWHQSNHLESVQLILAGRSWWDVLQYGLSKPAAPAAFRNLSISCRPVNLIDLQHEDSNLIDCDLIPSP